jgi:hypothetical protein
MCDLVSRAGQKDVARAFANVWSHVSLVSANVTVFDHQSRTSRSSGIVLRHIHRQVVVIIHLLVLGSGDQLWSSLLLYQLCRFL